MKNLCNLYGLWGEGRVEDTKIYRSWAALAATVKLTCDCVKREDPAPMHRLSINAMPESRALVVGGWGTRPPTLPIVVKTG